MRISRAAVLGCLIALVPASGAEAAKPKEPPFALRFALPASNGYELTFTGHSRGSRAQLTLTREGARVAGMEATFRVRARTVSRRRVVADFGRFGQVNVRFDALRKVKKPGDCRPRILGRFEGSIEFEGEEGFAAVSASGANGAVKRGGFSPNPLPCFLQRAPGDDDLPFEDWVFLIGCRPSDGLGYGVIEGAYRRRQIHVADLSERIGQVDVRRFTVALGKLPSFTHSRDGRRARVSPPAPFSGRAALRDGRLRGDVAVPFPGKAPLPLTPMRAGIREDPNCDGDYRASARLPLP